MTLELAALTLLFAHHGGHGHVWFFPFFWIFFIGIFFVATRIWGCGWGWRGRYSRRGLYEDADDILRGRFARGEIDEAEYKRLRDVLAK